MEAGQVLVASHSPPEVLWVFFSKKLFHVLSLGKQVLLSVLQVENLLFQFCAEIVEQCW